jgi:2-oxoglutarate ferredoxin oxidoreductase subunit gamma
MFRTVREKLKKTVAYNICVLGVLVRLTGVVSFDSIEPVLAKRFEAGHHESNLKALRLGAEMAASVMEA